MKKIVMIVAAIVAALALQTHQTLRAQEPAKVTIQHRDTIRGGWEFYIPDSLAHAMPWHPDYRDMELARSQPAVTMTSVLVAPPKQNIPSNVMVLNNNSLRLGHYFNLSVGQAQQWGSYQDSFLDARTISMPLP